MRLEDPAGESPEQEVPLPAVVEQPSEVLPARRPHLVAVVTRAIREEDAAAPGATIRERFWHPHHHRWMEEDFASLDALRRRHTEEEQWQLIQEQQLDEPLCFELIFKAHRIDFTRPSREQILRDIGMTPDDVSHLLKDVEGEPEDE